MKNSASVSVPNEAILKGPIVLWSHIDGPLMQWAGHMHWLTFRERLALAFRCTTVTDLAEKHWPHLAASRVALREVSP